MGEVIKDILDDYVAFIKDFEGRLIQEYGLSENPFHGARGKFDRKGVIGQYAYQYHGAGCRVESAGIVCEYDVIRPPAGKEIEFSEWKFGEFVRTHPKYAASGLTEVEIEQGLFELINRGILGWLVCGPVVYKVYQVL